MGFKESYLELSKFYRRQRNTMLTERYEALGGKSTSPIVDDKTSKTSSEETPHLQVFLRG